MRKFQISAFALLAVQSIIVSKNIDFACEQGFPTALIRSQGTPKMYDAIPAVYLLWAGTLAFTIEIASLIFL
jgi:hypothetical protein